MKSQNPTILLQPSRKFQVSPSDKFVAFVGPEADCAVQKVVGEYAKYFDTLGWSVLFTQESKIREVIDYGPRVVVLFRAGSKGMTDPNTIRTIEVEIERLKMYGVRVVYYLDDFLVTANNGAPLYLASKCDTIIVSTSALKEYIIQCQVSKPVSVVKTHMDIPEFDKLDKSTFMRKYSPIVKSDKFKVLMSSSGRVGATYLRSIIEMMNDRSEEFKNVLMIINSSGVAQMRVLINEYRNVNKLYLDWLPLEEYYKLIKNVDLIIAPAVDQDLAYFVPEDMQKIWLDSKSAVKYTLAGAAGIPIITSPVQSYVDAIKHGENGLIANTPDEFLTFMTMLINNEEYRKQIGEAARKDVEENYNITKRFEEFYANITGDYSKLNANTQGNFLYAPPLAGGPRTFFTTMEKHLNKVSNGKWQLVDSIAGKIDVAMIIAFYGLEQAKALKKSSPSTKVITRVDGLPMKFDGTLDEGQLQLMKESIELADQVIWQSQHCKDIWGGFVSTDKGVIIHNGADTGYYREDGGKFEELPKDKIKLLHANFSTFKHKRIDILLDLMKNTPSKYQYVTVGQYLDTSIVNDQKLFSSMKNVTFLGPVASYKYDGREFMASLYRSCDALIFTSEMEGSPNTVLEAASCGLPIIYNDSNTVIPEILGEFCIPIGGTEDLLAALERLEDSDYIRKLKDGMRTRMKWFTAEVMANNYLEVLENLCGTKSD